jgi:hypothetical protein
MRSSVVGYGRAVAERTVWIAEDIDYDHDLGGWVCTGTFHASVQTQDELIEEVDGLDVEAALDWGRARAARVLIRYGYSDYFSAGAERAPDAAPWPPPDLSELVRRRVPDEQWKDRTEADPPISWRVEARLEPPGPLGVERRPGDVRVITDLAHHSAADDWDGHLIDEFARKVAEARGGAVYLESAAYRLYYKVEASTATQATDEVRSRLTAPAGWELSIAAEPG